MRLLSVLFLTLGLLGVTARHHHVEPTNPQDPLYWLDKSVHHNANSPLMSFYQPEDNDKDSQNGVWENGIMEEAVGSRDKLCHKYACPGFNSTALPTFTKRSYPNVTVACTTIRTFDPMKMGELEAFKRLYEYFGGENDGNHKLNMTVPVVRYVQPGAGNLDEGSHPNVTICFFISPRQSMNPPIPKNSDVHVMPCSFDVLVHPFEGWSTHENVAKALGEFEMILHLADVNFNKERFAHASYTEPWILWPRYNEIWLMQGDAKFLPQPPHESHHHAGGPGRLHVHHGGEHRTRP